MVRRLLNKLTKVRFVPQDMRMFIQWVCIGIYAWPLILKLPYTLRSVYEAFRPDGGNLAEKDFWAFGPRDAGFRPWYLKIARDYHTQGRLATYGTMGWVCRWGHVSITTWLPITYCTGWARAA